jgi:DUF1009 family protein
LDVIVNKLGLIAGNGNFPIEVARAARERAISVIAVAHRGETLPELASDVDQITWIKVGELERMIQTFKDADVKEAAMAGGISRARLSESFAPDSRALAMLARIGRFSDDSVLRGVAAELEADGIAVIDPVPLLDHALAPGGLIAGPTPSPAQLSDLRIGFRVLEALGDFDVGQSVAVRDGVVAAIEAVEGTDAVLRRAAAVWGPGLVIAKAAKRTQDLRFDRPTVGPATIDLLKEINAGMLGIEAAKTLLLDRHLTLSRAAEAGITIYGHQ